MRGTRLRPERRRHCSAVRSSVQAARFLTLQDTEARITDSFALLKMLCENADEIAEEGFTRPFRQLMLLGQGRSKMA
jgi:hypothetical protein